METIKTLGKKAELQQKIDNLNRELEISLQRISGADFTPVIYNYDNSISIKFVMYLNSRAVQDYSLWIKATFNYPILSADYSNLLFSSSSGGEFNCNDGAKILEMKTLISFTENSAKIWDLLYQYHIEFTELYSELENL